MQVSLYYQRVKENSKVSGKSTNKKKILLLSGGQDIVPTYNSKREAKRDKKINGGTSPRQSQPHFSYKLSYQA
jgi:hypothetical protein